MKKSLALGMSLVIAASMTACGSSDNNTNGSSGDSGDKKPVTLTLLSHYVGTNETAFKPYVDQWNKENPDIQIKLTPVEFGELLKTIMTKQSAGQGADIMHVYTLWGGQLSKNNVLAEAPASVVDDVKTNYPEAAVKGASLNGTVFGYPTEVQTYGLFYNKKLLSEAGYEGPPQTWDEMLEMAKKIEKKDSAGKTIIQGFGFQRGYAGLVDQPFFAMMAAAGESFLSDDYKQSNLMSEAGQKTFDFYSKVYGKNGFTDISVNATKGFGAGQVGMTIGGGWWAGSLKTLMKDDYANIGAAPIPTLDGQSNGSIAYTWAWGVNSKSKHQEEAWKFLEWLNAQPMDNGLTAQGNFLLDAFNTISTRKQDLESQTVLDKLNGDPIAKVFTDALQYAKEEQNPAAGSEVQDILFKQIEAMWTDSQSAEDSLKKAHEDIEAKLNE